MVQAAVYIRDKLKEDGLLTNAFAKVCIIVFLYVVKEIEFNNKRIILFIQLLLLNHRKAISLLKYSDFASIHLTC